MGPINIWLIFIILNSQALSILFFGLKEIILTFIVVFLFLIFIESILSLNKIED